LHIRNTAAYSIAKNHLYFVCHNKPDKGQEDFNCCCSCPDDSFLCEGKCISQQSEICYNTYSKALPTWLYILSRWSGFARQPWRGSSTPETDSRYTSTINTDIELWKLQSVGGFSIALSSKPTRTSANFDHQSSLSIRNQILHNKPAVMQYTISVTGIQKINMSQSPLEHVSNSLTNQVLVPNCS